MPGAEETLARSIARLNSLLEASRALAVEFDLDPLLAIILEKATSILEAERSTIFLFDPSRQALRLHLSADLARGSVLVPLGVGIAGHVAQSRQLLNIVDAYADPRFNPQFDRETGFRTRSILCAPLLSHKGDLVGVIQLLNRVGGGNFGADAEEMLMAFASIAGVAIDRAALVEVAVEARRVEEGLRLAHDIQMSMLPRVLPAGPALDISASLTPARSVGGDFYDVLVIGERVWFAVGDASGKGVAAALFTAMTLTLFRVSAAMARDPGEVLERMNRELARDNESLMFVTVFAGVLDASTGELSYANAGHPPPYLLGARGVAPLEAPPSPALGIVEDATYAARRVVLGPGEGLLLFTDGVTEAQNPQGGLWGSDPLELFLRERGSQSCAELTTGLVAAVRAFEADAPPADDLTILALRRAVDRAGPR